MGASLGQITVALVVYVLAVVMLGMLARRRSGNSPEEYFLAGRGLRTAVLFMALFGTNATAFVLVGIPGQAYHDGIGTFGVNLPIICLGIPLTFYAIGAPLRLPRRRTRAVPLLHSLHNPVHGDRNPRLRGHSQRGD